MITDESEVINNLSARTDDQIKVSAPLSQSSAPQVLAGAETGDLVPANVAELTASVVNGLTASTVTLLTASGVNPEKSAQSEKEPCIPEDELAMWVEFKKTKSLQIREQLILKYAHFVKYVSGRMKINLPDYIDFEDLVSWGTFGLINAVDKFDFNMNIKFVTYATKRIRGAIIDGLRLLDWVPRAVRTQSRQLSNALYELEMKLGHFPSDDELSEHLGLSPEEIEKMQHDEYRSLVVSLDEVYTEDTSGEVSSKYQLVENIAAKNPEISIESDEVREVVIEAIGKLSDQEKLVITLYYYNELTLKEIANVMSLSESRVSQLHTKSILRLRGRLSRLKKDIY